VNRAPPSWVTESIAGMGRMAGPLVTKTGFRFLQTLYDLGGEGLAKRMKWPAFFTDGPDGLPLS
jgi:hypothetical protein